jgi:tryptophan synthase alpha chain
VSELASNRLVKAFGQGAKTLVPFITAGYPDAAVTGELLWEFQRLGVRVCELGVPYSDPVADGPVIQNSYTHALAGGVSAGGIFDTVAAFRARGGEMAVALMVTYSIVYRHGVEAYVRSCAKAGVDGLIIPDLPLDEAAAIEQCAASAGLAVVMLIAPTTPPQRQLEIASRSRGFIYFISVAGTTGQRDRLPERTIAAVADLRKQTATPVCVGFGVASPDAVAAVCRVADGAIVGSAIVARITQALEAHLPKADLVRQVGQFVGELLQATKS